MKTVFGILFIIFSLSIALVNCDKCDNTPKENGENTTELTDERIMDTIQKQTFKYFWDYGHPVSGLIRDRSNGSDDIISIGGTGFGIMAIIVGIGREYITYEQGRNRIYKICKFLNEDCTRYHGAWAHWVNGSTGATIPFSEKDNGGDLVETTFLIQGMLTAREYFSKKDTVETELRQIITSMWESVEWTWFIKGDNEGLYWHWSPDYSFEMGMVLRGFDETMITYILALASPNYPVSKEVYENGWIDGNYTLRVDPAKQSNYGGPLFFTHYSFLGLTPYITDKYLEEAGYVSYHERNKEQALLNRQWCINQSDKFNYYNENCWGLTASDDPDGYLAHEPSSDFDNGTISPTAAISSIVYTPVESLEAMKYMFSNYQQIGLWGEYGFKDAFNLSYNWVAESYLAIDQGPVIIMIENYRTGLLWKYFMQNKEIANALEKIEVSIINN